VEDLACMSYEKEVAQNAKLSGMPGMDIDASWAYCEHPTITPPVHPFSFEGFKDFARLTRKNETVDAAICNQLHELGQRPLNDWVRPTKYYFWTEERCLATKDLLDDGLVFWSEEPKGCDEKSKRPGEFVCQCGYNEPLGPREAKARSQSASREYVLSEGMEAFNNKLEQIGCNPLCESIENEARCDNTDGQCIGSR